MLTMFVNALALHSIARAGMFAAVIGIVSSTVFLCLTLVAAFRFRRLSIASRKQVSASRNEALPPVTILKPLHGSEPGLESNLESFFIQDYPDYEIVFGCRTSGDPALGIVERLRHRHPTIPVKIVLSGSPAWPNAKVYSLAKMIAASKHDYMVISDSDIRVSPDLLRNVVVPLLSPENGLVTCMYGGVPGKSFWSQVEALGMSVELASGVIVADMLEGMRFALGAVIALRRSVLEKIGGIEQAKDYCADDFILGNMVAENAGSNVVLSHFTDVGHSVPERTLRSSFVAQRRWMQSTRYSRPKGHLGTVLTFSTPFGFLALACGAALNMWPLGIALFAWSVINRAIQSVVVGWGVVGDRRALTGALLYPIRDFLGFCVWCASYLGGNQFIWRGEEYRLAPGGRIIPITRSA